MGLAPNHHLPLAAVHAHTIARHNPGSDADLALAAYCQPGGDRLRPAPFPIALLEKLGLSAYVLVTGGLDAQETLNGRTLPLPWLRYFTLAPMV